MMGPRMNVDELVQMRSTTLSLARFSSGSLTPPSLQLETGLSAIDQQLGKLEKDSVR